MISLLNDALLNSITLRPCLSVAASLFPSLIERVSSDEYPVRSEKVNCWYILALGEWTRTNDAISKNVARATTEIEPLTSRLGRLNAVDRQDYLRTDRDWKTDFVYRLRSIPGLSQSTRYHLKIETKE